MLESDGVALKVYVKKIRPSKINPKMNVVKECLCLKPFFPFLSVKYDQSVHDRCKVAGLLKF